jgi:hypothetical protein
MSSSEFDYVEFRPPVLSITDGNNIYRAHSTGLHSWRSTHDEVSPAVLFVDCLKQRDVREVAEKQGVSVIL